MWEYKTFEQQVEGLKGIIEKEQDELNRLFKAQQNTYDKLSGLLGDIRRKNMLPYKQLYNEYQSKINDGNNNWHPLTFLALMVETAGFDYQPDQDIIKSTMYNFQRLLGYCPFYDDTAFLISARIDCEVIKFNYESYEWMIELWKGQYGIETGCEIGVYRRPLDQALSELEKDVTGPIYTCVPDEARLFMFFNTTKQSDETSSCMSIERAQQHWWLTGFRWGVFSEPENLLMQSGISFPDKNMRKAFISALEELGYSASTIKVIDSWVYFTFDKPKTPQPQTQKDFGVPLQILNSSFVATYNLAREILGVKNNDPNVLWNALTQALSNVNEKKGETGIFKMVKTYFEYYYNNRLAVR